jgi:hypothetical protein
VQYTFIYGKVETVPVLASLPGYLEMKRREFLISAPLGTE